MKIDSQLLKKLWQETNQVFKLVIMCTSRTNNLEMGFKVETWIQDFQIECNGHFIHIENQVTGKIQSCNVKDIILEPPIEFWNIDTQFGRVSHYINHPDNLPTIQLADTA